MPTLMADPTATFAQRLKAALDTAGMSQRELARRLDVRGATVSSWCVGRTTPDLDDAYRIARLLGVTLESLCDPTWYPGEARPEGEP